MIPIYKPFLPPKSLEYAHEALDSGWISSTSGRYLQEAQEKLQELFKVKYVQLLVNGTCACHLMTKALSKKLDVVGKKKILVPTNSYVACWNSLLFDQEYQLICVKTDLGTWNIDLDDLHHKLTIHPDASVLIVHNIGNIINVPELKEKYPNTIFLEDNCEGLLGQYEGQYSGTASFCSAVSFFGNKTVSTGEGAALLTNSEGAYQYVKCIQGQGQSEVRFIHNELGYNYRMTNIVAGLLVGQLGIREEICERKADVFERYRTAFRGREDILLQKEAGGTKHSNWMLGVRIPSQGNYEVARAFFEQAGIEIRPMFFPIWKNRHLANHPDILHTEDENAERLNRECLILPSYPELTEEEQGHILRVLEEYLKKL
jgi:perosamine synthetase